MKKLTVIIPAYNAEKYIDECIGSVLMQKVSFEYQVIIIDDKSTDKTLEKILSYEAKYSNLIRVFANQENLGVLATTIKGYEKIDTEYFCVLDSDDYYIDDEKFQKAIDFLDRHLDYTIYTTNNYIINQEDGSREKYIDYNVESKTSTLEDFINRDAILGCTLGGTYRNVVFSKGVPDELYDAIGTIREKSYEGDAFRNILHLSKGKAYYKDDLEAVYRVTNKGVWTSLSSVEKELVNARFYYNIQFFLDDENFHAGMTRESFRAFNRMLENLSKSLSLKYNSSCDSFAENIDFQSILELFKFYLKNKDYVAGIVDFYESIKDNRQKIKEKNQIIQEMTQIVQEKDQVIASKDYLILKNEKLCSKMISDYQNSLSWKITKPMRYVVRKLKGLFIARCSK
ncbi:glycosyltransferase family 2 protein [Francisella philomiragia]|uniref:Glycosyltransferase family 2 protein n=1 Tax=Francisella philomiragia TaxID=28110 RepID=A0ABS1G9E0_9GAMM|nr:glycosyltransferase family 2 protein [Francisella philomiragia]MBK2257742.1 glycosyltransferase family 2 protein [Francisella philomiragia]MBK2301430.1 glycosyltransferase family 2 protein [Francisella philomiragia]